MTPAATTATQLTEAERDEIVRFCSAAYDEDLADYCALLVEPTHVVLRDETGLIAHGSWVTRWLVPASSAAPLRTAYVELVATRADARGHGRSTAIMRRIAELVVTDYDIAALSPAITGFYERLGWEHWRGPLMVRQGGASIPPRRTRPAWSFAYRERRRLIWMNPCRSNGVRARSGS